MWRFYLLKLTLYSSFQGRSENNNNMKIPRQKKPRHKKPKQPAQPKQFSAEEKELLIDTQDIMDSAIKRVYADSDEIINEFYTGAPLTFEQRLDLKQQVSASLESLFEKTASHHKTVVETVANYSNWEWFHAAAMGMREVHGEWAFPAGALNQMDDLALAGNHRDAHFVNSYIVTRFQYIVLLKHILAGEAKKKGKGIIH